MNFRMAVHSSASSMETVETSSGYSWPLRILASAIDFLEAAEVRETLEPYDLCDTRSSSLRVAVPGLDFATDLVSS